MEVFDAIVLAGGSAQRMGGTDKALIEIAGVTLLERAVEAVGGARRIVGVGPPRPIGSVRWTRETPPGGGPAAGVGAGIALVEERKVVVLGVDTPFITRDAIEELVQRCSMSSAALACDDDGRPQPSIGAYPTELLRARLTSIGEPSGTPLHRILDDLAFTSVPVSGASLDCDTWDDVERARAALGASDGRT